MSRFQSALFQPKHPKAPISQLRIASFRRAQASLKKGGDPEDAALEFICQLELLLVDAFEEMRALIKGETTGMSIREERQSK